MSRAPTLPKSFRSTTVSGGTKAMDGSTGAASDATIARFALGGLAARLHFVPEAVTTGSAAFPNADVAPTGEGWRETVAQFSIGAQRPATVDASGNGRTADLVGSTLPALVASPWSGFGNAFSFDGVNRADASSGVIVRNVSTVGLTGFCLEAKINRTRQNFTEMIIGWFDNSDYLPSPPAHVAYMSLDATTNTLGGYVLSETGAILVSVAGATVVTNGVHTVALTWDGATVRLFLDGALQGSAALASIGAARTAPFGIGRFPGWSPLDTNSPYPFAGTIDEVRLSSVARYTAAYTPATTPFTTDVNTMGLWQYDAIDTPPNPAQTDRIIFEDGAWRMKFAIKRSGQLGELDQYCAIHSFWSIYSAAGVWRRNIGYGSRGPVNVTTALVTYSMAVRYLADPAGSPTFIDASATVASIVPSLALEADERIYIELWVDTYAGPLGAIPTPPVSATDLIIRTNDGSSAMTVLPNFIMSARRTPPESAPGTESVVRRFTGARAPAEAVAGSDSVARVARFPRGVSESVTGLDVATRVVRFNRGIGEAVAAANDVVTRAVRFGRGVSEAVTALDAVTRIYRGVRNAREYIGGPADWPLDFPTKAITGIVRNAASVPVQGATVKLFRQSDDFHVATTTSAIDGSYSFLRDLSDPNVFYVIAFSDGVTHGVSDRDLVPVGV